MEYISSAPLIRVPVRVRVRWLMSEYMAFKTSIFQGPSFRNSHRQSQRQFPLLTALTTETQAPFIASSYGCDGDLNTHPHGTYVTLYQRIDFFERRSVRCCTFQIRVEGGYY